jgi:hypothetical protein
MLGAGSWAVTTGSDSKEAMAMEMKAETGRRNRDDSRFITAVPLALRARSDVERFEAAAVLLTA